MKQIVVLIASCLFSSLCLAQVGTTASEGAKATSEKAQQVGDQAKAGMSSGTNRTVNKAKAHVHKAKAHHHAKAAKHAAKEVPK